MNNTYLNHLLFQMLGNQELVKLWWQSPNRAFGGSCPQDVCESQVLNYLEGHTFG